MCKPALTRRAAQSAMTAFGSASIIAKLVPCRANSSPRTSTKVLLPDPPLGFAKECSFRAHSMNKYAFLTEPVRKDAVIAEGSGRLAAAYAKHCEPRSVSRGKSLSKSLTGINKNFSLIIRADDGSTLLETHVDYMHQAFQRLIDWSIEETGQDVCAVITGPNGFYKKHRIKASRDFGWIESPKEP